MPVCRLLGCGIKRSKMKDDERSIAEMVYVIAKNSINLVYCGKARYNKSQ
jgi:hypothetical protein